MSYILEALKKAETERERGAVPGLGSVQTNYTTYIRHGSGARQWGLLGLALVLLLAVAAGLWFWRQPGAAHAPQPPATAAPVAASVAAPPPQASASLPPAAVLVTAPHVSVPVAEPPGAAPVAASTVVPVVAKAPPAVPASVPVPAPSTVVPAVPTRLATQPASQAVAVPPQPAEAASKPVATAAVNPPRATPGATPMLSELPESLRRQIPALAISGAIYSDSPAEWTLIVNDQVMGKGSQVAPDVRLEDISATSAVFSYKGQRFRVDH